MKDVLHIDGSQGEGGGQILRTSFSLSAITQRPIHLTNIRAGRPRPGLRRQHLTAIEAIAKICGGNLRGAEIQADELHFEPGPVQAGDYEFSIGTAGSACLVFQTLLWPLLFAEGKSSLVIEGGTHNPGAPTFDFIERCFLPVIRRMGAGVEARLERHGFMPAGGGKLVVEIEGGCKLSGIDLHESGEIQSRRATALVCNLPGTIAIRELRAVRELLEWKNEECLPMVFDDSDGPGNVLLLELVYEQLTEMVSVVGERHVSAEDVAALGAQALERYLDHGAPVGRYLADQLLLAFVLAGEGSFRTGPLSEHSRTNMQVVGYFLDTVIERSDLQGSQLLRFSRP